MNLEQCESHKRAAREDLRTAKMKQINTSTLSEHKWFNSVVMRPVAWLTAELMAHFTGRIEQFTISKPKRNWSHSYTRSVCVPSLNCHTRTHTQLFSERQTGFIQTSLPPTPTNFSLKYDVYVNDQETNHNENTSCYNSLSAACVLFMQAHARLSLSVWPQMVCVIKFPRLDNKDQLRLPLCSQTRWLILYTFMALWSSIVYALAADYT